MASRTARTRLPAVGRSMRPTRATANGARAPAPAAARADVPPKPKPTSDATTLFVQDVALSLERITSQPAVMMTGIIAVVIILSHLGSADMSILDNWIRYVKLSQPRLGDWLYDHESWLYGVIAFVPAVLSVSEKRRAIVAVACLAWILVLPHRHPWEYLVQAVAVRIFFTTNRASTRTILVVVVAGLYWLGLMSFSEPAAMEASTNKSAEVDRGRNVKPMGPSAFDRSTSGY